MRLISLKFEDPQASWELEETVFFSDLTLLVGLSGVGKTRILDTIIRLKRIVKGNPSSDDWGTSWKIQFEQEEHTYDWSGKFEEPDDGLAPRPIPSPFSDMQEERQQKPKIILETLKQDGRVIASREGEIIKLSGEKTPKLSQEESIVHILRREDGISDAYRGMKAILPVDHSESHSAFSIYSGLNLDALLRDLTTIEKIRSEDIPTKLKLALVYKNCPEIFSDIINQFRDAFPYVEDVKVDLVEVGGPFGKTSRITLQEAGVDKPIPEESISSGMMRTLMHLSRMWLWPDGTVVLIDEFENSFGINCMDFVTHDLLVQSNRMQFILTSHHPYIINNVDMKNWKIVSRNGRKVSVQDSSLLNGTSRHEAFLQLLNLPEYADGITGG
ncbi:MAG: hypothetical protein COA78_10650 [Blastopirellula sp.]|nr:MAG: hypothetical protein COA78_10650 [Blastopirellula sp.]